MKPLAIIGFGPTHDDAPWDDDWEFWGLVGDVYAPRCHSLFEMHTAFECKASAQVMNDIGVAIYMQQRHPLIEHSVEYPLARVIKCLGRDYFGSSIAYMIGLAALRRGKVGLWGVDLGEGYNHQIENLAWMIGRAEGEGVEFADTPSLHSILPYVAEGPYVSGARYPVRYGYTEESQVWPSRRMAS